MADLFNEAEDASPKLVVSLNVEQPEQIIADKMFIFWGVYK